MGVKNYGHCVCSSRRLKSWFSAARGGIPGSAFSFTDYEYMTAYFLNLECITGSGRTARSTRTYDRYAHVCLRALDARNEAAMQDVGGGSADTPARAPRRTRTTSRKPATGDDGDGDGDSEGAKFTISTSPTDGIIVGTAAFCTAFMLMAQYGGKAIVPIETVCADYFSPLTLPNLRRKIAAGDIPLPLVRMETGNVKAAQGIHISDLAAYIDERRAAAVKERDQLCN
jgi:hypothetical protein